MLGLIKGVTFLFKKFILWPCNTQGDGSAGWQHSRRWQLRMATLTAIAALDGNTHGDGSAADEQSDDALAEHDEVIIGGCIGGVYRLRYNS